MKTVCIYHSRDLDGWCSAAIVKKKYPDAELIGYDYGMDYPKEISPEIILGPTAKIQIILVDVSFEPVLMNTIRDSKHEFIWIDHHKSAIQDSIEHGYQHMAGTRDREYAACELTWKYFFPDKPIPYPVELLGLYDSFRHKELDEENGHLVILFQYAARAYITDPDSCAKVILTKENTILNDWRDKGTAILNYLNIEAQQIFKKAVPFEFEDHQFLMVNRERFNPVNFGIDYHSEGYDGFICFWFDGLVWTFSLYNDNGEVDVSEIAKKYGGGGHKGAAGFTLKSIDGFIGIQEE